MGDGHGGSGYLAALDVFSGVGGLGLGWLEATREHGGRLIGAVDHDPSLRPTYERNFPGTQFIEHDFAPLENGDSHSIARALSLERGDVDVVLAGPPCQSFSSAGKRTEAHLDNRLPLRVAEIARELHPKVVVIENVPDFAWAEGGRLLGRVRVQLAEAGYETQTGVLNASSYGVPQVRQRCFLLAVASAVYRQHPGSLFPAPTSSVVVTAGAPIQPSGAGLPNPPTVLDAIGDLPALLAGEGQDVAAYGNAPQSRYGRWMRRQSDRLYNHVSVNHSSATVTALARLSPGETPQRDASHPLRRKEYFRSAYARLVPNGLAPTMTTQTHNPGSGRFTHYAQDRVLTVREVARLQSFPDEFRFFGDSFIQRRHVGNAVPPLVAEAISRHLLVYLL